MNASKTEIDFWCFAGCFQYRIFEIIDGRRNVFYMAEPNTPSATRIADTLEELRVKLRTDVNRLTMLKNREKVK